MDEDELDPRIQVELEKLNTATDEINKLEIGLDEANTTFRMLLSECTRRLKVHSSKHGSAIVSARPYYEALEVARSAQQECQRAAVSFQRANEVHDAAKETVALAEARFQSQTEWRFDSAWQEMLNHATLKVGEAEKQRADTAAYHGQATAKYKDAQDKVYQLEQRLRRSVAKSRPYFEEKQRCNDQLSAQKEVVESLQAHVAMVKSGYASSLRRLEGISEEIHRKRAGIMAACRGVREPGVGAELEFQGELDRCDEPLKQDRASEPSCSFRQGEPSDNAPPTSETFSRQGADASRSKDGSDLTGEIKELSGAFTGNRDPLFKAISYSLQDESLLKGEQGPERGDDACNQGLHSLRGVSIEDSSSEHKECLSTVAYNVVEEHIVTDKGESGDFDLRQLEPRTANEEKGLYTADVVLKASITLGRMPAQYVAEANRTMTIIADSTVTTTQGNAASSVTIDSDGPMGASSSLNSCIVEEISVDTRCSALLDTKVSEKQSLESKSCLALDTSEMENVLTNAFNPDTVSSVGTVGEKCEPKSSADKNIPSENELISKDNQRNSKIVANVCDIEETLKVNTEHMADNIQTAAMALESDFSNKGANMTANVDLKSKEPYISSEIVAATEAIRSEEESVTTQLDSVVAGNESCPADNKQLNSDILSSDDKQLNPDTFDNQLNTDPQLKPVGSNQAELEDDEKGNCGQSMKQ